MPTLIADPLNQTLRKTPLRLLRTVALDIQATGQNPATNHLLEMGWSILNPTDEASPVRAMLVRLPDTATLPASITRITGLRQDDFCQAAPVAMVWHAFADDTALYSDAAAEAVPAAITVVIIHYARFELPYLHDLHKRFHPDTPFPSADGEKTAETCRFENHVGKN